MRFPSPRDGAIFDQEDSEIKLEDAIPRGIETRSYSIRKTLKYAFVEHWDPATWAPVRVVFVFRRDLEFPASTDGSVLCNSPLYSYTKSMNYIMRNQLRDFEEPLAVINLEPE
jgi:hypothetical protein